MHGYPEESKNIEMDIYKSMDNWGLVDKTRISIMDVYGL